MIVAISGIDGSGKTSVSQALGVTLRARGYDAEVCKPRYFANHTMQDFCAREFGDRYLYHPKLNSTMYVYGVIVDWMDFLAEKLLHHEGRVIICDRWYLSDVFSQAVLYEVDTRPILDLTRFFPRPDVSLELVTSPLVAYERLNLRVEPKIHCNETLECLVGLSRAFEETRRLTGWCPTRIQTDNQTFEDVLARASTAVFEELEKAPAKIEAIA